MGGYGSSSVRRAWSTRNDAVAFLHEFGHNLGWHHSATDPEKVKGQQSVELTWASATDPSPGTDVDMYKVYRDGSWVADVSNTRYVDSSYTAGGTTIYDVYAVDQANHVSSTSVSTSFTDSGSSANKGKGHGKPAK